MKFFAHTWLVGLAILLGTQSHALAARDELVEGAKLCTRHLPRFEREYAIPTHLLSAIASTESGRYHQGLKIKLPWPWTINANGKGYYLDSKEEAIAMVRKLRSEGITKIDVGCMQVNLYHHPEAFASLDQAFEPKTNIAYAATFLRNLYNEEGTWKKAASDYHSKTPSHGAQYVDAVYDSWFTIIEKLRAARLRVPENAVADMNSLKPASGNPAVVKVTDNRASAPYGAKVVAQAAPVEPKKPAYQSPRMNSIEVVNTSSTQAVAASIAPETRRESNIMVIQPAAVVQAPPIPEPAEMLVAAAQPAPAVAQSLPQPQMASKLDGPSTLNANEARPLAAASSQPRKSGPNFIFND